MAMSLREIAELERQRKARLQAEGRMKQSVMSGLSPVPWQPDYERKGGHAIESVSPEDFIPSPKTVAAVGAKALAASKGLPMLAGTLIGKSSPMFNRSEAAAALRSSRAGLTPEQVWQKHPLNWIMPNGRVAQELDDSGAKIVAPWLPDKAKLVAARDQATEAFIQAQAKYKAGEIDYPTFEPFVRARLKAENDVVMPPRTDPPNIPLEQFMQHPTLYQAYPELGKIDVRFNPHTKTSFHSPDSNMIEIGTKGADTPQDLLAVTTHEVTHPTQGIEQWAEGGSPTLFSGMMAKKNALLNQSGSIDPKKQAEALAELQRYEGIPAWSANNEVDAYTRLFGEQAANAVQARAHMSLDERKANFIGNHFTAPVEETIWRRQGKMSYPPFVGNAGGYGNYR